MNFEELLSTGTAEVSDAVLTALSTTEIKPHRFSRRFKRKMKQLIFRHKHPVFYQMVKSIACVILVMLLSASLVFAAVPKARAAAERWLINFYQTYIVLYIARNDKAVDNTSINYTLSVIPDGYAQEAAIDHKTGNTHEILYYGKNQELLIFHYSVEEEIFYFPNDNFSIEQTFIGADAATILYDPENLHSSVLSWYDSKRNIFFSITAFAEQDELIRMAESVIEQ